MKVQASDCGASRDRNSRRFYGLALAITISAAWLRFVAIENRPMHADEAILADKLGTLIETGSYRYNLAEHHGPALLYLTYLPARLAGIHSYSGLDEQILRSVPAIAGTAVAVMALLLCPGLSRRAALIAAALTAVSPAMVFYSRYYIPEMLLVSACFTAIVCGWRYAFAPSLRWALLAGACAGIALTVKETAILAFVAGIAGLAATGRGVRVRHVLGGVCAAIIVVAIGYRASLPEFIASFGSYASRAFTGGQHPHPWYFYLGLIASESVWAEASILLLAITGGVVSFRRNQQSLPRFLAVYTIVLATLYSVLPYKTPWCMLGFWQGSILLAGHGASVLPHWRPMVAAVLALAAWQSYRAAFLYEVDPRNPYVYAQTTRDVLRVRDEVERLATAHPRGYALEIQVFHAGNVWPLPWYLRRFPNVRWASGVPKVESPAPVILVSPSLEPALAHLLYESRPPGRRELYMMIFDDAQLRPGVELRGYVAKTVWDHLRSQ